MAENPLVSLGELSKPVNTLVERASDAVGGLFRPWQTRRVARAEAEAELIHAQNEIQITELHKRAFWRFLEEKASEQLNMESILTKAIPGVDQDNARPEDVEKDWFANFFDKCRIVSDEEMQDRWARILAGEANSPGSFSKRTVNLMADLEKHDADMFVNLCRFVWEINHEIVPIIVNQGHEIYRQHEFQLRRLSELGLVTIGGAFFALELGPLPKNVTASYYGKELHLTLPKDTKNSMNVGQVRFTTAGLELFFVSGSTPYARFYEYVYDKWANESLVPPRSS